MNSEQNSSSVATDPDEVDESIQVVNDDPVQNGHSDESDEPDNFRKPDRMSDAEYNFHLKKAIQQIAARKSSGSNLSASVENALRGEMSAEEVLGILERHFPGSKQEVNELLGEFLKHPGNTRSRGLLKRIGSKLLRRS